MIDNSVARVLIAPDSFKGSAMSTEIAEWIAQGWRQVRANDLIVIKPMADGGEGTLLAIEASRSDTTRITQSVMGPDNRSHNAFWLLTDDGIAIVELASICGITLQEELDPIAAHTYGLGQVLYDIARDSEIGAVLVALGGSASTDGGTGALRALGYRFKKRDGSDIAIGASELTEIVEIEREHASSTPPGPVIYLVDVVNPLLGDAGAARTFAPQKGASPEVVEVLEQGLAHFQLQCGVADAPGAGAAGGVAYGLSALWGGELRSGARTIAAITKVVEEIESADVVITGEGNLDGQSFSGKVVGTLAELVRSKNERLSAGDVKGQPVTRLGIVAGGVDNAAVTSSQALLTAAAHFATIALEDIAGSRQVAMEQVRDYAIAAGGNLAEQYQFARVEG